MDRKEIKENIQDEIQDARDELNDLQLKVKEFRNQFAHGRVQIGKWDMSAIALSALIGLILGGAGAGITVHKIHKGKEEPPPKTEEVATKQIDVQLQLTDLDLLKIPCSDEYIAKHDSDLLCRELFCMMQSRGIDSQTAGSSCEEISNISNTIMILDECKDAANQEDCYRLFRERK